MPGSSSDDWKYNGFAGHNDTFNCAFADGHVKTLKPTATMSPFNMWGNFYDNSSSQGPGCFNGFDASPASFTPNCDAVSQAALQGLQALQDYWK